MPVRRLRTNRLPVPPPPLRHRAHSRPSSEPRESSLERVRRIAREHRATEKPFDPERRGTWKGSSRDLVVNGRARYTVIESKRRRGPGGRTASPYGAAPWTSEREKSQWHLETVGWTVRDEERGTVGIGRQPWETKREAEEWVEQQEARRAGNRSRLSQNPRQRLPHREDVEETFLVIEEDTGHYKPTTWIVVNPLDYPRGKHGSYRSLYAYRIGAYGSSCFLVWGNSYENTIEELGGFCEQFMPGLLTSEEDVGKLMAEAREDEGDMDDEQAYEKATADLMYTEAGYFTSYEVHVDELVDGPLYKATEEACHEEYVAEYGEDD